MKQPTKRAATAPPLRGAAAESVQKSKKATKKTETARKPSESRRDRQRANFVELAETAKEKLQLYEMQLHGRVKMWAKNLGLTMDEVRDEIEGDLLNSAHLYAARYGCHLGAVLRDGDVGQSTERYIILALDRFLSLAMNYRTAAIESTRAYERAKRVALSRREAGERAWAEALKETIARARVMLATSFRAGDDGKVHFRKRGSYNPNILDIIQGDTLCN